MRVILPRQSLEIVSFTIATSPVDPATLTHECAVVGSLGLPDPGDWFAATFASGRIEVLIRASTDAAAGGQVTLAVGRWRLWWRASSNPEFPVRPVGIITVV